MYGEVKCKASSLGEKTVLVMIKGKTKEGIPVETGEFQFVNIMDEFGMIPGALEEYHNLVRDFQYGKIKNPPIRITDMVLVKEVSGIPTITSVEIKLGDQRHRVETVRLGF